MSRIYFRFYPGDYLRDTLELTLEQDGAYRRLIDTYWMKGGPICSDSRNLARIWRVDLKAARRLKTILGRFWDDSEPSVWRHKRIDAELLKGAEFSKAGRKGGMKSTLVRQAKRQAEIQAKLQAEIQANGHTPLPLPLSVVPTDKDSGVVCSTPLPRASPRPLDRRSSAQVKAEKEGKGQPMKAGNGLDHVNGAATLGVYIRNDSRQWSAWSDHRAASTGQSPPVDRDGGWWFPSEWPPGYQQPGPQSMELSGKLVSTMAELAAELARRGMEKTETVHSTQKVLDPPQQSPHERGGPIKPLSVAAKKIFERGNGKAGKGARKGKQNEPE